MADGSSPMEIALPQGAPGQWCRVRATAEAPGSWWTKIELADRARGQIVRQAFLGPIRRRGGVASRQTLLHIPFSANSLSLRVFGEDACIRHVAIAPLGRKRAAWLLLLHGWRLLPKAMRGDPAGLGGRVRAVLGQAPARAGEAPPYGTWIDLYDRRDVASRARSLAALSHRPPVTLQLAVTCGPAQEEELRATLHSIDAQWLSPPVSTQVVREPKDWRQLTAEWVGIACAGEVLADHALASFAQAIGEHPHANFLCADTDDRDDQGVRRNPRFKPMPGPVLLPSGRLTTGLCLFRRTALPWQTLPADAPSARLACAILLAQAGQGAWPGMLRVPAILTHCQAGMPVPPAPRQTTRTRDLPRISMIVPTAARSSHVRHCLRRVALATAYPDMEILVAVTATDRRDRRQARLLAGLARLPRLRLLHLDMPAFNYAEANNLAAAEASGDCLLLLNDDVTPIEPCWLRRMAELVAAGSDIVGARLLYGNGMVQHGGVIMGLAELCEHDGKLSGAADPGPSGLAHLDRDVTAVTAACMLVRTSLYQEVGGLDPAFAIALNDVDFCLRAGARGARIAVCAGATLHHYESLSLGRHYEGERASLEATEVRALRERWPEAIRSDPFYNPQASREPGREWQPAFPPATVCIDAQSGKNRVAH